MNYKIFIIGCVLLLLTACRESHPERSEATAYCLTDSLLKKSSIDTVKTEAVMNELNLSGKITFNEDNVVKLVALASGHVQEVKVSLGDYVNEGQVLAVIKSSDMAGYFNEFVNARSNLAIAKKNFEATKDFYKGGLSSERELNTAEKEFLKAESEYNKINEIIKIYGGTSNPDGATPAIYYIKAPISGFIVEKAVTGGMEIRSDDNANLFTISGLKDVWVIANLYESDIDKVQAGYEARVNTLSYKDKLFAGKIDKISSVLNPETKALNIRIRLENPEYLLKPGMFARITVSYPENEKMLAIPKNSIVFDENKNFVVKFQDKCNLRMTGVTIVKTIGNLSYIEGISEKNKDGLRAGDRVITNNALFIFTALKKL